MRIKTPAGTFRTETESLYPPDHPDAIIGLKTWRYFLDDEEITPAEFDAKFEEFRRSVLGDTP